MDQVQEIKDDPRPAPSIATEEEVVRRHFLATCEACRWNLNRVAEALGLSHKTIYNRLNRYEDEGWVERDVKGWKLKLKEQVNGDGNDDGTASQGEM